MQNTRAFEMDLDISGSEFKTIVHAVTANENRKQFARRSIYTGESQANSNNGIEQSSGKYRLEKGFLGAHSDIGGGYKDGDLSNASLMWMIKQAQEKGNIKFKDYSQYNQVNNPIVHDSLWSMALFRAGGQFRWATDDSKDKSDVSIYNSFTHLGLNWKDTELFQNPNNQKFTDIRNRYADLIAKDKSPAKGSDMTDGGVLMANEKGKRIDIQNYLIWLRCSYKINLTSDEPYEEKPNLTEQQLCSGNPLQTYLKK